MIKNFVFDFGNVVINWDTKSILKQYTTDAEKIEILKKVIFDSQEWYSLDKGKITLQDAKEAFENKVPNELKDICKDVINTWYKKVDFNDNICKLIKDLKKSGYKVYALSNTNIQFYEYIKNLDIGKYFDGYIISAIEKQVKPDREIYYRLFEKFSLIPEECFFIDDMEKNIIASKECKMDGFIFNINKFEELENKIKSLTGN